MPSVYPFGGIYSPFGTATRNQPVVVKEVNPLGENDLSHSTGNAGRDGYTVLSRASRVTRERPMINGYPQFEGPLMDEQSNGGN